MARYTSRNLGEYPHKSVRLACRKCGRQGQLSRERLVRDHGPDITLPDLRPLIADCPRTAQMHDPCGAYYVDLSGDGTGRPGAGGEDGGSGLQNGGGGGGHSKLREGDI